MIRQYALVRITKDWYKIYQDGFGSDSEINRFIYLGEIPNMLGHCVIIGKLTNTVYSGWHTEIFEEIPEDEV